MKRVLAIAVLGVGLAFGGPDAVEAATVSAPGVISQSVPAESAVTRVRGGWWAVPAVIGGVILFDHLHRRSYGGCYRRCRHYHGPRYCRRAC
jgi:hypothetical protein